MMPTKTTDAVYLRPGDNWVGGGSVIRVYRTELLDNGLLRIVGRIVSGVDRGYQGSWSVQLTQPVEVTA